MPDTTNTSYDYLDTPVVEYGKLKEQGVLNVALSFFGLIRHYVNDATEKEVVLFKQVYPIAKKFCIGMADWSFLVKSVELDDDDIMNDDPVPVDEYEEHVGKVKGATFIDDEDDTVKCHVYTIYKSLMYGYTLPSDFMKVKYIDNDVRIGYAIKGNSLYCNFYDIVLDYVSDITDSTDTLPLEFGYLVAYRCAIEMAHHLDPEGTAFQRATSCLSQTYTILKQKDDDAMKLQNPAQNHYVDIDSVYWGYKV